MEHKKCLQNFKTYILTVEMVIQISMYFYFNFGELLSTLTTLTNKINVTERKMYYLQNNLNAIVYKK